MGSPILTTILLAACGFVLWRLFRMVVIYWPDRYWPREHGEVPEPLHNIRVLRGDERPFDWEAECPDLRDDGTDLLFPFGRGGP